MFHPSGLLKFGLSNVTGNYSLFPPHPFQKSLTITKKKKGNFKIVCFPEFKNVPSSGCLTLYFWRNVALSDPNDHKLLLLDDFDPAELIDGIRQLYKCREGWLAPFPWCEEFHFHLDNVYTRLKVISRKKERGTATNNTVDMSEILKPHEECSQPRTVLIEGKPGMGKTTYCKKLVYDWATRNQEAEYGFPTFETVLLLRCRDMKSDLWEAIDDQLLPRDVKEDVRERFFDFVRRNQSNVLLILDGLDEIPANRLPKFSEILQGRVLPKCRLVATARHEAGIKVRIHCDTLLEIEGFTDEDARNFILKYFKTVKDLAAKLLWKLHHDRNLKTLTRNPLNTALLCLFCEDRQGEFPENRGQLYQEVVQCILRRYRKKEGLPETEDDLLEVYKSELKHLGWIALEGLSKDSLDFEESKLALHLKDIPRFGFLSVQPGGSKLRPCYHYSFLHKSFQEWFAAYYLCCLLVEGKISPDKLLNKLDVDEVGDDDSDEKDVIYWPHKENFHEVLCFAMSMLEARCQESAVALIKSMAARVVVPFSDRHFWFFLAACCIIEFKGSNSNFFLKLAHGFGSSLGCNSLKFEGYKLDKTIIVLAEALKVNTTVQSILVTGYKLVDDGASCLADALKQNSTLTTLHLHGSCILEDGGADLADALKVNTTLTELILPINRIGDQGAARFADALRVNKTLTKLDLTFSGIGNTGAVCLADALKSNTGLQELDLSHNVFDVDGFACLGDALQHNTTLGTLYLDDIFFCLDPANINRPPVKAVVTELLRLARAGRVVFR